MDTFIPPSTPTLGTTYTTNRYGDYTTRAGSDFFRQQQHHHPQQGFQYMMEGDREDEFTVPECLYDMPATTNTPVPSPIPPRTIEEEGDIHVVEAEDTPSVTPPANVAASASPQEQQVAGHDLNGAGFERNTVWIAQTNIDLYLPEHVLDFRVDLDHRTITVENCWYSKFPWFLGAICLLLGVMSDCHEGVEGAASAGAAGGIQINLDNRTTSQRVIGPPLTLKDDVENSSGSNSSSGSSGSGGGGGSSSRRSNTVDATTRSSIFGNIAGMLNDVGQALVNVLGLDHNSDGTLPRAVSGRITTC